MKILETSKFQRLRKKIREDADLAILFTSKALILCPKSCRSCKLTIHGHSHEAVSMMEGEFTFSIGGSTEVAVGPGNDPASSTACSSISPVAL